MSEVEPLFIVRMPDGRKSKPSTKERIREMHLTGKVSDEAIVTRVGTVYDIPIRVFLGMSSPKAEAAKAIKDSARETEKLSPRISAEKLSYDRNGGSLFDAVVSFVAAVLSWPFRGFIIPARGVNPTRDYLRRVIVWIEVWLFLMHFASVIVFGFMAMAICSAVYLGVRHIQQNGTQDLLPVLLSVIAPSAVYFWMFLVLMLGQSIIRLVPAALRYWIETTEERRTAADRTR
jgi:hypothetical protein